MRADRRARLAMALPWLLATAVPAMAAPRSPAADASGDAPMAEAAGARFAVPEGWARAGADPVVLTAPEGDLTVAIVDAGTGGDAAAAVERAWSRFRPGRRPPVRLALPLAARDGWEERGSVVHEAPAAEHRTVEATAARAGGRWTVAIVDGSTATLDKRQSAVSAIVDGLRPAGAAPEDFGARRPHRLDAARIAALRDFVATSMAELGIPGAAIAIVQGGRIVHESGLGVKQLGRPDRVGARSLFMIASNTKPLTTLLLARLVDEGRIGWDEPVARAMPAFRLGSAETTKNVLVRHLVCACTGLPRKDFGWIFGIPADGAEATFAQLAAIRPTSGFGTIFQYSNLMAAAGGYVAGHVLHPDMEPGAAYDRAMRERIFAPLGMADTIFSTDLARSKAPAMPHGIDLAGRPAAAAIDVDRAIAPYRPAGGAWSTAHDMALYVRAELADGALPGGGRIVSAGAMRVRRARGVPSGDAMWYGMGIEEGVQSGISYLHHGGSLPGYMSDFFVIPGADTGAVILTNSSNGGRLLDPFLRRLIEILYDGRPEAASQVASAAAQIRLRAGERRAALAPAPDPRHAAALAARYVNAELGHIDVRRTAEGLRFDFGLWSSAVRPRLNRDGTTTFVTIDPGVDRFEFTPGTRDGRATLTTREAQYDYVYVADGPAGG